MADSTVSDTLDRIDTLHKKLAQLEAMLHMTFGTAGDTFRAMSDSLQDNYLWACSTLTGECNALAEGLSPARVEWDAAGVGTKAAGNE